MAFYILLLRWFSSASFAFSITEENWVAVVKRVLRRSSGGLPLFWFLFLFVAAMVEETIFDLSLFSAATVLWRLMVAPL